MNSNDLLRQQGWRGAGFSLDNEDRGLVKPILTSRKADLAGLGTKQHDFTNQWWLKAWDKSSQPPETLQPRGGSTSGTHKLYQGFVKSEPLHGTLGVLAASHTEDDMENSQRKRRDSTTLAGSQPMMKETNLGGTKTSLTDGNLNTVIKHEADRSEHRSSSDGTKKSKKRKHAQEVTEPVTKETEKKSRRRDVPSAGEPDGSPSDAERSSKTTRKPQKTEDGVVADDALKSVKRHKKNKYTDGEDGREANSLRTKEERHELNEKINEVKDLPNTEAADPLHEKSTKKRKHRSGKDGTASVIDASEAATSGAALFTIDTVGDHSQVHKIEADSRQQGRVPSYSKHQQKMPLSDASGNRQGITSDQMLLGDDSKPKSLQLASPKIKQPANPPKPGNPGYQKTLSLASIQHTVATAEAHAARRASKAAAFEGQKEKRRSPRIIRKEARALKQAALIAEAREKGEPDPVFPKPLTKSEKRYERRFKKPTARKQKKIDRKLKRQQQSQAGVDERKRIEREAFEAVEQMQQSGTMPDISKPVDELIAEKRAELIAEARAEGKPVQGVKRPKKPKVEPERDHMGKIIVPKSKIDKDRDENGRIVLRNLPPGQQELPADFKIPAFKTLTMGIPIPNTKKRGSLKELHKALVEAGLTKAQISAYTVKAIQEKKQMRLVKDQVRKDKREARKRARAIKKQAKQAGNAKPKKSKEKVDKSKDPAVEKRAKDRKKKKEGKEQVLKNNTGVILARKMAEKRELGNHDPATALEVKQSRREARKLVRMAKKGRLTAEEVPKDFRLKRSQKLKLVGNGGRIPKWTAPEIWSNIESARREAIATADRQNQPKAKPGA